MGWFSRIFANKTKDWFFGHLPANQTPDGIAPKTLIANQEYLHIILKSMRIVNVRKGLSKFYATVHSHIEVAHISGKASSFNYVTTPGNLEKLDSARIDRVINVNRRLLGPVPYRGSDVKVEVGLFSVKEADLAAPFIKLLTDMSALGGVSFISAALPYVKPLETGIELLTGSTDDTILEIGLNKDFNVVETGYYVVMRANKDDIDITDLRIDADDFKLVDTKGNAIADYPYFVFEISAKPNRDDWYNIPDISNSYNELRKEVEQGNYTEAGDALKVFKRTVYISPDLIFKDAKVIYQTIETEINQILDATRTAAKPTRRVKQLSEYSVKFE